MEKVDWLQELSLDFIRQKKQSHEERIPAWGLDVWGYPKRSLLKISKKWSLTERRPDSKGFQLLGPILILFQTPTRPQKNWKPKTKNFFIESS